LNERRSLLGPADLDIAEGDAIAEPRAQRLCHSFFRSKLTSEVCEPMNAIWNSRAFGIREALSDEVTLSVVKKTSHRLVLNKIESEADYSHITYNTQG